MSIQISVGLEDLQNTGIKVNVRSFKFCVGECPHTGEKVYNEAKIVIATFPSRRVVRSYIPDSLVFDINNTNQAIRDELDALQIPYVIG